VWAFEGLLDVGGDLGPAEGNGRADHVVPRDDVAGAPLDNHGLLKAEPCEARGDRGNVAAAWIPRVELDGVDRDHEGAQLGRDVGGRSAVAVDGGCYGERGSMRCHVRRTGD
jgi:hypothetical protein